MLDIKISVHRLNLSQWTIFCAYVKLYFYRKQRIFIPSNISTSIVIKRYRVISHPLPFSITFPNTEASLSNVLQFQRWSRNWSWHSLIPILAPSPRLTITPGCMRQRRRCLPASPGTLSHSTPAPTA